MTVSLDGEHLTLDDLLAVARHGATVDLPASTLEKVERSRAVVEQLLTGDVTVYGVNTGFGSLRDIRIDPEQARELQRNLLRSHACGVGNPTPVDAVRAMMLLRANTLAKGFSGVRPLVIQLLIEMLNRGVHPVIPLKGSVGASGDLAPLSHLALVLIGEGEAFFKNERLGGSEALRAAGLAPIVLEAKEGLALTNGTQFMTAIGVLALLDAEYASRLAVHACALSHEAMQGVLPAFDERLHAARNQPGQSQVAALMRSLLAGGTLSNDSVNYALAAGVRTRLANLALAEPAHADDLRSLGAALEQPWTRRAHDEAVAKCAAIHWAIFKTAAIASSRSAIHTTLGDLVNAMPREVPVQNDYCMRCAPQVIGAAWDMLAYTRGVLSREINAATDNPLIIPSANLSDAVISGGNFHGAPVALALDCAALAIASVASIAERRIFHLTTGRLSNGLPRFLAASPGLQSGLMLAQVTAASLVSENKTLCHPASADSIPTVEDAEDHVSMGAFAARKFAEVVGNVQSVIAIELMCAARGTLSRKPAKLALRNEELRAWVGKHYTSIDSRDDKHISPEIEALTKAIANREFPVSRDP